MRLLLARHGNTFEEGVTPVIVGAKEDLPLVEKGEEQARTIGRELSDYEFVKAIFCGDLKRTRRSAEIISSYLPNRPSVIVDYRLTEINYGDWGGLSDAEVAERYGAESLEGWNRHCIWPLEGKWGETIEQVEDRVGSFYDEISRYYTDEADSVLVITSNGILRFFLKLDINEFSRRLDKGSFKVATGNCCLMEADTARGASSPSPRVQLWNGQASELRAMMRIQSDSGQFGKVVPTKG